MVEEVEALSSIYGESFIIEDEAKRAYSILLNEEEREKETTLLFQFPVDYPAMSPPTYQISAPWLKGIDRQQLSLLLNNLYLENIGESVIFTWVEGIREFLQNLETSDSKAINCLDKEEVDTALSKICEETSKIAIIIPKITHGEVVTDRKSNFQGHVASITCITQLQPILNSLLQNRKIANATHNIYAYRIKRDDTGSFSQDYEDDGESQAGGRLLHLLQLLQMENVVVVVSRWYGGIHLGPDRFRHINNAARQVLQQAGMLPSQLGPHKSSVKK